MASVTGDFSQVNETAQDLQTFQRTFYRALRGGIKDAAERFIVPRIKAKAIPRKYRAFVNATTRNSRGGDYQIKFSTRTQKSSRILGIQNFGGYLPAPIRPRRKKAIRIGNTGIVVAQVNKHIAIQGGPRHGLRFYEKGIDAGLPRFNDDVGRAIADRLAEAFRN